MDVKEEIPGIISMECYFPKYYVSQKEYESYKNVVGKYTIGLGQNAMSFTTDREDICSLSMTVTNNLLNKNNISYNDIGYITVATETIIDHSKSISSYLMNIFNKNGNNSIEGCDVKHACYAGTFALFSAFDRITSSYWDGKLCIVIAADIAEYAEGAARCTGGCGAVALLLGKNGCINLDVIRSTYKAHQYDFYKPNLNSPYPIVNGHVSNQCYINALDACYTSYSNKYSHKYHPQTYTPFVNDQYWVFHSPYNGLVKKTYGRVIYNHFLENPIFYYNKYKNDLNIIKFLQKYENIPKKDTVNNREVIKGFQKISKDFYDKYVSQSTLIPREIGNCYTASIFMGLLSLISSCGTSLCGKNVSLFSYGSGTIASLYSLKIHNTINAKQQIQTICDNNNINQRLLNRIKIDCDKYTQILNNKINTFHNHINDFIPQSIINHNTVYDNTYYLTKIDKQKRRFYSQYQYNNNNNNKPKLKTISFVNKQWISHSNKIMNSINNIKLKAKETGSLSQKGAIKIDKILNTAQQIQQITSTTCSNS